jgi:hypothetical protein
MAPRAQQLLGIRIGVANALAWLGCAFMTLLLVMLIYKAATNQLLVPSAIYIGLALSVAMILFAELVVGSVPGKSFFFVAAARTVFALLLKPFLILLASAFDADNWVLATALIVVAFIVAQPTVKFFEKPVSNSTEPDRSAI